MLSLFALASHLHVIHLFIVATKSFHFKKHVFDREVNGYGIEPAPLCFSPFFTANNLCEFLLSVDGQAFPKSGLLLKEIICSSVPTESILPLFRMAAKLKMVGFFL